MSIWESLWGEIAEEREGLHKIIFPSGNGWWTSATCFLYCRFVWEERSVYFSVVMNHMKSCVVPVQVNCAWLISLAKPQGSERFDFTVVEWLVFYPGTSSWFFVLWTQTVWEPGGPCTFFLIFTRSKLFLQVLNTSLNFWTWWRIRICILRPWSCTPLALRSTRCVSSWQCSVKGLYSLMNVFGSPQHLAWGQEWNCSRMCSSSTGHCSSSVIWDPLLR